MREKLIRLKEELDNYPNPPNEIDVTAYCIRTIDKSMGLSRYEKKSFSNHLSKIMIQERIKGIEETQDFLLNKINIFQKEVLEIIDYCVSDWSYIEKEYNKKFEELKKQLK